MKLAQLICFFGLGLVGCMQHSQRQNVLRTEKLFKPQGPRRASPELELVVDRTQHIATLQHPARCDGVIRHTSEIETIDAERPSVGSYILSGSLLTLGAVAVGDGGSRPETFLPIMLGGGLLTTVLLLSTTDRKTHFEQRWLPQRDHPCGGLPEHHVQVRVGLGAAAVDRTTDNAGQIALPAYVFSATDPPAAFVGGRSIPVRFFEPEPQGSMLSAMAPAEPVPPPSTERKH